jgi:hypothetical protein
MLISQFSLATHSINGGRGCKCRVEVGIWRVLITQLSLERPGWALLSSPLKHKPYTEIGVANSEAKVRSLLVKDAHYSTLPWDPQHKLRSRMRSERLRLTFRLLRMLITILSLETHNVI